MANDYSALVAPLQEIFPPIEMLNGMLIELAPLAKRPLFRLMPANEILEVRKLLGGLAPIHDSLIFAFTNDAGDYLGCWVQGPPAFGWAWYRHDGNDLLPVVRSFKRLKLALESSPDAKDLPSGHHDYPDFKGIASAEDIDADRKRVALFREDLGANPSPDDANAWFTYRMIMTLTPHADVKQLVPFLDATDDYARELAVMTVGGHRHARAKIEEIAKGKGNAALAAQTVLARWE